MSGKGEIILVRNLPPKCTLFELEHVFRMYTDVLLIGMCNLSHLDKTYDLRSAWLLCSSTTAVDIFEKDKIDIVVRDYFTEVEMYNTSDLILLNVILLGIPENTTEDDIRFELDLDPTIAITIETLGCDPETWFAYLRFPTQERRDNFYLSFRDRTVNGAPVTVEMFPKPNIERLVTLRCHSKNFVKLRPMTRFNDFTIHTPKGPITVSSKIMAMSSPVVARSIADGKKEITVEIDGNFEEVIMGLYGENLVITRENSAFIHGFASILQINDLVTSAGCVLYESLTLSNYRQELERLLSNNFDIGYVVDFIAGTSIKSGKQIDKSLPVPVLQKLAKSPYFRTMKWVRARWWFEEVLDSGLLTESDIVCVYNESLNMNENREMLVEYMERYQEPAFTMRADETNERTAPAGEPSFSEPALTAVIDSLM